MLKRSMLPPNPVRHGELTAVCAAFEALRRAWPAQWPGLPRVLEGVCHWLSDGHPKARDTTTKGLLNIALAASRVVEHEGARQAAQGLEPAYHNRLHIADTLVGMAGLLKARRAEQGTHHRPGLRHDEVMGLLAMTVHDFQHTGRINAEPGEVERHSLYAFLPHARRLGLTLDDWSVLSRLVLNTDPATVGHLHDEYRQRRAVGSGEHDWREMAVLVTEADVLASALAEPGMALGQALTQEWRAAYPDRAARLATPEGRLGFLTFGARFSSPAARRLGIADAVQGQIAALTQELQARRRSA